MKNICVGKPNILGEEEFFKEVKKIFKSRWLTNDGKYVRKFENEVAHFLNVKHAIAVCNGTVGLEIAAKACGLKRKVIVPSFTFIATAHALKWIGLEPIFCDIDPFTHNIDPLEVEKLITPEVTGIVGVHLWGRPCAINALQKIADKYNIKLIFDAAHAFGCSYQNTFIGNFGEAEVFSFHATKFFNTFEGGMITTNNDELAENIRRMKNFGFKENVITLGTNGKMSEMCAAMGIVGLSKIDNMIEKNRHVYELYKKCLNDLPPVRLIEYSSDDHNNYQYIVIETNNRDLIQEKLMERGIFTKKYFYPPCHLSYPYKDENLTVLKKTESLAKKTLCLPTGPQMTKQYIYEIYEIIKNFN